MKTTKDIRRDILRRCRTLGWSHYRLAKEAKVAVNTVRRFASGDGSNMRSVEAMLAAIERWERAKP